MRNVARAEAWGLGHAVVGHRRRVAYGDGTVKIRGNANPVGPEGGRALVDRTIEEINDLWKTTTT